MVHNVLHVMERERALSRLEPKSTEYKVCTTFLEKSRHTCGARQTATRWIVIEINISARLKSVLSRAQMPAGVVSVGKRGL